MLRLVLFIFGIVTGFVAALIAIPLPGKTFFNRMSKLPVGARDLVDNSIDLSLAILRVVSNSVKEIAHDIRKKLESMKTNESLEVVDSDPGQIEALKSSKYQVSSTMKKGIEKTRTK